MFCAKPAGLIAPARTGFFRFLSNADASIVQPVLLLSPSSPVSTRLTPWAWVLLGGWLAYSFGTLAWYLINDPAFMASICKVT